MEYDEDRFRDRVDYDEDRVVDFPEDAAGWTGRKVEEVEVFPDDIRERFDDDVEVAYDEGRDEVRYDDY